MSLHESVLGELEFAAYEAVRELPGVDRERAHVASDLLVFTVSRRATEHHFEHALAGFVGAATDQHDQVGLDRHRNRRGRGDRKEGPRDVDAR